MEGVFTPIFTKTLHGNSTLSQIASGLGCNLPLFLEILVHLCLFFSLKNIDSVTSIFKAYEIVWKTIVG